MRSSGFEEKQRNIYRWKIELPRLSTKMALNLFARLALLATTTASALPQQGETENGLQACGEARYSADKV